MQNHKILKSGGSAAKRKFSTLDDALEILPQIEELVQILKELGERKYPLAVRKGRIAHMAKTKQLKHAQTT